MLFENEKKSLIWTKLIKKENCFGAKIVMVFLSAFILTQNPFEIKSQININLEFFQIESRSALLS